MELKIFTEVIDLFSILASGLFCKVFFLVEFMKKLMVKKHDQFRWFLTFMIVLDFMKF